MWLGPPYINRKITLFAFAGSNGGLRANGLANCGPASARCEKKPSPDRSEASAAAPKPQPVSHRNSRRVRPQKSRRALEDMESLSVQVDKFVQIEHRETPVFKRVRGLLAALRGKTIY